MYFKLTLIIISVIEVISYIWVHKLVHSLNEIQFGSFFQIFKCVYFDFTISLQKLLDEHEIFDIRSLIANNYEFK